MLWYIYYTNLLSSVIWPLLVDASAAPSVNDEGVSWLILSRLKDICCPHSFLIDISTHWPQSIIYLDEPALSLNLW